MDTASHSRLRSFVTMVDSSIFSFVASYHFSYIHLFLDGMETSIFLSITASPWSCLCLSVQFSPVYTLAAGSNNSCFLKINPPTIDSSCYIWPGYGFEIKVWRKRKGDLINLDNLILHLYRKQRVKWVFYFISDDDCTSVLVFFISSLLSDNPIKTIEPEAFRIGERSLTM